METIEDSYGFSDDFVNFLSMAAANDPTVYNDEEAGPEEDKPEAEEEEPEEDWKSKYEQLQQENETLRQQVNTLPDLTNPDVQNDDFLSNYYSENTGKTGLLSMVLSDNENDYSESIKTKSDKVNLSDVDPTITKYLSNLQNKFGSKVVVTSGNDQEHAPNSRHYKGEAVDIRYSPEVHKYISNDPLAKQLGLNVLDPNHGTAKHSHIQKKQNGGKYKV